MLQPPPLKHALRYPVTVSVSAAAIVVTAMWWLGQNIEGLLMNGRVWADGELWRALTSTLPHVNIFHLAFNLYWFWTFGALVEQVFGHLRCAMIFLLLAFVSMLAEFTFFTGGAGLSGVGYGLWGMLWVLEQRDPRFAGVVDRQTSQMFIGWFFLCILLTVTNVMPVANVAHGAGAATGALLGLAASSEGVLKWKSCAGLLVAAILALAGSTVFWPWVNLSADAEPEVEHAGLEALEQGNFPRAVKLLETSTHMRGAPARAWYNLGVAYERQQNYDEALTAFEQAAQMPDGDSEMQKAAENMKNIVRGNGQPWRELQSGSNTTPKVIGSQTNQ